MEFKLFVRQKKTALSKMWNLRKYPTVIEDVKGLSVEITAAFTVMNVINAHYQCNVSTAALEGAMGCRLTQVAGWCVLGIRESRDGPGWKGP